MTTLCQSVCLISGSSHPRLAVELAGLLDTRLTPTRLERFADHEIFVQINESVRGRDVYVIQSTSCPANDHVMELLILLDALRRGSARRITAVIPYFGYARQDRKTEPRTPITARLMADLLTAAGADRVLTVDLHSAQIQGFFNIPLDNMEGISVFIPWLRQRYGGQTPVVVSPDIGGLVRARRLAGALNADIAIVDKRRSAPGRSEVMQVIGEVAGRPCVLFDDMVDSGGTLVNAAGALIQRGACEVIACATHGVLSGEALTRLQQSPLTALAVTDSIPQPDLMTCDNDKRHVFSLAPLLAEAIHCIASDQPVSSLFLD